MDHNQNANNWFLIDSGSEVNVCNNRELMHGLRRKEVPVKTASGETVTVKEQGKIKLDFMENAMDDTLCGINWKNILSVGRLVVNNELTVEFSKDNSCI